MSSHVVALCGGVGGAKLAFGLAQLLAPEDLSIVVNTGDDFEHFGLSISPDIDTVIYTLAGLANPVQGWGLEGETWSLMTAVRRLGMEDWFNLGDQDVATHLDRTQRLKAGQTLSEATAALALALEVRHAVIPMSDGPAPTTVMTTGGELTFQRYFVGEQCRPAVSAVGLGGLNARPSPGLNAALTRSDVSAVIICPSNPYLSIDPILALPGVREGLARLGAPIVAVSPIIGGRALKGPAAKLMTELGVEPGVAAIARHYGGLLDGLVIDNADTSDAEPMRLQNVQCLVTDTIMDDDADRVWLARETLDFAAALSRRSGRRA